MSDTTAFPVLPPAAAAPSKPQSTQPASVPTQTSSSTTQSQLPLTKKLRPGAPNPVSLNEAALDSPTFRASTVHFSENLDVIERWLDNYIRSTSKVVHDLLALEDSIHAYLQKIAPPPVNATAQADAIIDTDYTFLALRRAGDGARDWWTGVMATVRRMEPISVEPIRNFVNGELRTFKEARRALEAAQKTFDTTLARYVSQNKTKEPSALREDAFAVFETRKAYLKASMDFCQSAPQLRFALDKLLVRVCADMYREMRRSRGDAPLGAATAAEELERIRGWSKEMESYEPLFRRELQAAKKEVGEATLAGYKPSREIEDYSVSTVPYLGSRGPMNMQQKDETDVIAEKQGWLFLRVVSGKPARTTWVRRWYYCRNFQFGWLMNGPQGVLQGDEIGVLLCSAKPAVQEERRFCFEVKTKTQTLLLQAETQTQLMEWLEVFEVAKKRAFEATMGREANALSGGVDPAFSINPSTIPEFSAKSLDSVEGDGPGPGLERTATLAVPGADAAARASFDAAANPPRRSITTTLGREEGESGREHAARLMQRLDLHRKAMLANSDAQAQHSGGIANLITASHGLIGNSPISPIAPQTPALRVPIPSLGGPFDHAPTSLAPATLSKPPVPTNLSRAAVMASATADINRGLPSAVLANYWGSNPWASSFTPLPETVRTPKVDLDDPLVGIVQQKAPGTMSEKASVASLHKKTLSVDAASDAHGKIQEKQGQLVDSFPVNYPPELRAQYAQFRLVFPTVAPEEKPVLVFNAAWSNSSGEGKEGRGMAANGRIFVTPDNMYFFGHQLGLVVAYAISLDSITEVTAAPGKDCDYIFLHLNQDASDLNIARITMKIFLEDFTLLHARLNLLVDDLQAAEPMSLGEVITALINLEGESFDKRSPSAESWEEVASNTPMDDGTPHGRPVQRRIGDVTGRFIRGARGLKKAPMHKFQLPAHPVYYEPEDMGKPVAERNFEISAKACFHVLFGDKSFIFPKLYFERRAKEIAQGPWELKDHGGKMARQFKFKVDKADMLGRKTDANIVDTQNIDIFNDHITYVVTHVKTPWHLPHSHAFKLITKVVITHVAKSKCKLAIYTKADWSKAPAIAKNMVERQALDDAANDAEELAEVATDQVRRLGPHSRTKRAIQVYGNIGQQTQVVVFSPNAGLDGSGAASGSKKGQPIRVRSLTAMILETGRSLLESAITSVMMWAFAVVKKVFKIITAHRVLLVLLLASAAYNLVVVSQSGAAWWAERKAARYMERIGVGPNTVMSKAIFLADLEEAAKGSAVVVERPVGSQCYESFQSILNSTDLDAPYNDAGAGFASTTGKATARRLRRTRQRLGTYRHDLLVAMRVVNGIEREMIQSEWENWLADENLRCDQVSNMLHTGNNSGVLDRQILYEASHQQEREQKQSVLSSDTTSMGATDTSNYGDEGEATPSGDSEQQQQMTRRDALKKWYAEYCGACEADQRALWEGKKMRQVEMSPFIG
ncbi:hypothetical protein QBC32DRAFT_44327 [Pseudoneurospora amorphoporcata]|uniref:Transcription factor SipA3 n=1 Tax=Pseudoneurospora amorphoporcata TaxID=241081 RepID=A0AAN6SCY0_9PEZI|nr:hypothetical protein QBC32DRAFT_44327 [Pseudoneurospora amorphoporcata]